MANDFCRLHCRDNCARSNRWRATLVEDLLFIVGVFVSALTIGWSWGFKILALKKAMETVVS